MANERTIKAGSSSTNYYFRDDFPTESDNWYTVGRTSIGVVRDGAVRFSSVVSSKTITRATIQIKIAEKSAGSGTLRASIYGIAEDNTGAFSSNPFGRSQTSAHADFNVAMSSITENAFYAVDITSPLQEVLSRAGWSSGNAVGLFIRDNTSDNDAYIDGGLLPSLNYPNQLTSLTIQETSNPDFNPTGPTVSAPTFPASKNYGIKIAYPGYDVKTATEQQLYFTTDKQIHKIKYQGLISVTGGVEYQIAHGCSYIPFAIAYAKSPASSHRYKIPRYFPPYQSDPDSDNNNGKIEIDATNVKITMDQSCDVYYYIFLDELST